jgi:hypothetical protein
MINGQIPQPSVNISVLIGPDDILRPVSFNLGSELTSAEPDADYYVFELEFTDEANDRGDGALFEIKPHKVTDQDYRTRSQIAGGSGTLLCILPSGEIDQMELTTKTEIIEQTPGWIECWFAGENGLKIIDSSEPHFQKDFMQPIQIDDPETPSEFWERYHELAARYQVHAERKKP